MHTENLVSVAICLIDLINAQSKHFRKVKAPKPIAISSS